MSDTLNASLPIQTATTHPTLHALWRETARSLIFRAPHWEQLPASPWLIFLLFALDQGVSILMAWLGSSGPQQFAWITGLQNAAYFLVICWLAYVAQPPAPVPPRQVKMLSLILLLYVFSSLLWGLVYAVSQLLARYGLAQSYTAQWIIYALPFLWITVAELAVFWHASNHHSLRFALVLLILLALSALYFSGVAMSYWYPAPDADAEGYADRPSLVLTQEVMEAQPALLHAKLGEVAPQRAGVVDLYTIAFAPEADEDVFRREAGMVSSVMAQRFDAAGRGIELINHVETLGQWPWATPLNLRRSITAIAGKMDQNEDILFVYLTSHGGQDGQLAAGFWPMQVDSVTPQQLKRWLDEAGVRHRVIAVSACYSGSWIAPLASADTLVLTAADADNTSYGCGRKSELTFFGRAMFDEQLRSKTRSFEAAHHSARELIRQREIAAGKDDGYSNPQISMGANIRAKLAQLEARFKP
ncbi:C13 family peptidase [Chitinibacter sp. GC72]|uniref:C13 family peptidase n=1 Tax=Chitinibacter sp. GC72 TaxID=1526917 RepID=UPI0012F75732|nr:C13 family peptidase [Chitinibacter sp. GC72]